MHIFIHFSFLHILKIIWIWESIQDSCGYIDFANQHQYVCCVPSVPIDSRSKAPDNWPKYWYQPLPWSVNTTVVLVCIRSHSLCEVMVQGNQEELLPLDSLLGNSSKQNNLEVDFFYFYNRHHMWGHNTSCWRLSAVNKKLALAFL